MTVYSSVSRTNIHKTVRTVHQPALYSISLDLPFTDQPLDCILEYLISIISCFNLTQRLITGPRSVLYLQSLLRRYVAWWWVETRPHPLKSHMTVTWPRRWRNKTRGRYSQMRKRWTARVRDHPPLCELRPIGYCFICHCFFSPFWWRITLRVHQVVFGWLNFSLNILNSWKWHDYPIICLFSVILCLTMCVSLQIGGGGWSGVWSPGAAAWAWGCEGTQHCHGHLPPHHLLPQDAGWGEGSSVHM